MVRRQRHTNGFTLIELVMVIVLVGILATLTTGIITAPIDAFQDQSRRAELTDMADNALTRIARELRQALPNSVRISSTGSEVHLEFLDAVAGSRYRAAPESSCTTVQIGAEDADCDALDFSAVSDSFDVLGGLDTSRVTLGGSQLVIYNTGSVGGYDAYGGNNLAAITAVSPTKLSYSRAVAWPFPIPPDSRQRFFVVNGPVSFVCDTAAGTLRRVAGYAIQAAYPANLAGAGSNALLASNVAHCQFDYQAGAGTRHGLVTLRISLRDEVGEQVHLLQQVHVVNAP